MKIILLIHQNNYKEISNIMSNTVKSFGSNQFECPIYNCFNHSTKLFSNLCLAKFLDTSVIILSV